MSTSTFTINITGIKTTTTNGIENVVKQVDWTMVGSAEGQQFDLPQTTILGDPDTEDFVTLDALTPEAVINWIESTDTRLDAIKAHIQFVLDKQVASAALTTTHLPWTPAPMPMSTTSTSTDSVVPPVV